MKLLLLKNSQNSTSAKLLAASVTCAFFMVACKSTTTGTGLAALSSETSTKSSTGTGTGSSTGTGTGSSTGTGTGSSTGTGTGSSTGTGTGSSTGTSTGYPVLPGILQLTDGMGNTPPAHITSLAPDSPAYSTRGIGGGGAMSGMAISPYSPLIFVGTDMGTLFRSPDGGQNWYPVDQRQAVFDSDLTSAAYIGFSADPNIVFHAAKGIHPIRSIDTGINWASINIPLSAGEKIKYWTADSYNPNTVYCATTLGLFRSIDKGVTWARVAGVSGDSQGTFVDYQGTKRVVYHANTSDILISLDGGASFATWYHPATGIKGFAAGRDNSGVTFAFIDTDGTNACSWANTAPGASSAEKTSTMADCGYIWTKHDDAAFARTTKEAGRQIRMAENNSQTIYVTGGNWLRQYGSKVWVSLNAGASWTLQFHQYNWDVIPFAPWPSTKLDYSPPGLEVGWDDNAYESFAINPRDATSAGGTGYYFLHTTANSGANWSAPFTKYADTGARVKGKKWRSAGLEVTSVMRFKFHPSNPQLGYASMADMAGMVTEDGGTSYRVTKAEYNTNYDYAFDLGNLNRVYAASGALHDWPESWHANATVGNGGIYRSDDKGLNWTRLTPSGGIFDRQFLSVAYDTSRGIIYGGTQGAGIARSTDGGATWSYYNSGIPGATQIIPQIEIDPANGNVYALLTGDAPTYSNFANTGVYYLDVQGGSSTWSILRSTVNRPAGVNAAYALFQYPTAFAVDWSRAGRDVIWMVDTESNGQWLATGAWKTTDRGATWNRLVQFTHPTGVTIDPNNSNKVYLGGAWVTDGSWGQGGAIYTQDGGTSWLKNTSLNLAANLRGVTLDPNDSTKLFYHFFGGGMLYGPRP